MPQPASTPSPECLLTNCTLRTMVIETNTECVCQAPTWNALDQRFRSAQRRVCETVYVDRHRRPLSFSDRSTKRLIDAYHIAHATDAEHILAH